MNVAALILAAGRSTRFAGGNKLMTPIDGVAMVRRVALAVAQSRASDIVLVVAPGSRGLIEAAGEGRWREIVAPDSARGLSASLAAGIAALASDVTGAAVVLADMPDLSAPLIDRVIAAFEERAGSAIAFPQDAAGRQGHPVVWPSSLFCELRELTGDTGGKSIIARHPHLCRAVRCEDPGAFSDIDRQQDLADRARH